MHSSPNPLPEYAVEIAGLAKTYAARRRQPAKTALAGVDLAIPRGSLFGLLGPNGAGKSTTINILAGLVRKTAGQVTIWGYDIDRQPLHARHAIGVVPQELHIDPFFTPREALEMHAGMFGVARRRGAPMRSWRRWALPTRRTPMPARCRAACGGAC